MRKSWLLAALFVVGCGGTVGSTEEMVNNDVQSDIAPTGKGAVINQNKPGTPTGTLTQAGILYHGGPVMTACKTAYFIWYGNWSGNSATTILPSLISGLNGSAYFGINTTYTNSAGTVVSNCVSYGGSVSDSYSQGSTLSDAAVFNVVANQLNAGALPRSSNAVYFVLTSSDVAESSGFCTQYCGWHTHGSNGGVDIKYSFVGNAARCPSACEAQTTSPNGNAGADAMASIIAHEFEEAATDPDLNAWYDSSGAENADKCAWTWGTTFTASNGSAYNVTLGGRNWLIQRNWKNSGTGFCSMN